MKPAAFDYLRADSADAAVAALAAHGDDARILAGGQSLMAVLNMRLAQPSLLIDISRSAPLAKVSTEPGGWLRIGAAATQASIEWRPGLRQELPLLALAFPHISHFQIRNRGTVAGSIAHADPSAELPLCLLALEGEVVLRNAKRTRRVKAQDFFTGMLSTARANDELLEAVRFPLGQPGVGHGFEEFSMRHGDFAVCAVAAMADAKRLRVAVGGVADRPTARDFPLLDGSALDDALNELAWSLDARDEPQASAALRRQLVRRLGRRAANQALSNRSSS
ncbi:FAD binding domain-containing protein [Variovorax ginsengisoli]|uniref:FAD binding domain-containing protein n=1 Tax=Variovorax ginsengisoli TaxID=363844 RepID=A0ABT8SFS4_9BURK|nr:FAD binding domain-containing protein [Variovorax ginsengisoli]MDN8618043.1 FAD binding domain-containing protein [Variovorax ginsengisoli]MDO1537213.1 FAD binding domain-containing protein [Variovorax ginsengisoli]